jgi:hypothetical protein
MKKHQTMLHLLPQKQHHTAHNKKSSLAIAVSEKKLCPASRISDLTLLTHKHKSIILTPKKKSPFSAVFFHEK